MREYVCGERRAIESRVKLVEEKEVYIFLSARGENIRRWALCVNRAKGGMRCFLWVNLLDEMMKCLREMIVTSIIRLKL